MASRFFLVLVLFLGLPGVLCAQKAKGQWSDLNRLRIGQGIEVIESNMKSHGGQFVAITDESITLRDKGTDISLKRENVARVSTSSGGRRGEHALIGLVVGGGLGAAVGALAGSSSKGIVSGKGIGALVGIVIGAPSGALIGAVVPAHTTIYRAAPAVNTGSSSAQASLKF
jgi:hypothetical protein